jgi:glycosyl-4,4'-diaponeurosporenoate acyltransferase
VIVVVAIDAAAWAAWSVLVGLIASRQPVERFSRDGWLTRPRQIEQDGRVYAALGIRAWKDRVPEAGALFGGRSKRRLGATAAKDLEAFAIETRRAELVHWGILIALPVFALWNPAPLMLAMTAYAVVANVPCIAIQRYNRFRIGRVARRRDALGARP